jgi:putative heme-binding domain-containing protein
LIRDLEHARRSAPRAFPLRRFLLPWAQPKAEPAKLTTTREFPEIAGGNWLRGRNSFSTKRRVRVATPCAAKVASPESIFRISRSATTRVSYATFREPGAALNPDRLAFNVEPKDGPAFAAVLIGEDKGTLQLADATGALKSLPRTAIKSMEALPTSLMPPGLLEALTPAEQRDLLTYLLIPALEPAPLEAANPPPPRKRAEVEALLKSTGRIR